MKREIRLNMQHLSEAVSNIQEYGDKLENLKSASTTFLNVLKNQDSVSYATLSEEWECGIIGYIDEIQGRLDLLESSLSNYIEDMKGHISPESKDVMMRVDRNDIWYNIQQIAQQYEQFLTIQGDAGSSYPDYRHFAIGLSAEEELLMREQEERERERRERNYQKLVSFRQGSVNNALNYFLENIGDINAIYKNAIIPFENTDDDYASLAEFYYDMWATTGDNWTDFLRSSGDICRGLGDATVDMLDGIASLGAFAIYESVPAGCSANGDLAFLPDCITERALGTGAAIEMLIKEPGIVVDCMGQNMMDTYEEEGLAYATGYVTLDVVVEILTTKGMRSVKGALRTTDATSDVMNTVAATERAADDILDAAEGAKNTGRVAENVTDVAGESSKIQEILRNKRVSDVYPELDELEKFYDDIYEQQRNICQKYEDYLDELRKLQSEPDIVPEGSADAVEEVAESILESGSKADVLAQNRANGRAFEQQEFAKFNSQNNNAVEQITVKTSSSVRTRVDAIGLDTNGNVVINEYKSSLTAPLTDNQKIAFPEIFESGATVVGKGKGIFSGGYQIPPGTKITIIRPD